MLKPSVINPKEEVKKNIIRKMKYYDEVVKCGNEFVIGELVLDKDIKKFEWVKDTIFKIQKHRDHIQ